MPDDTLHQLDRVPDELLQKPEPSRRCHGHEGVVIVVAYANRIPKARIITSYDHWNVLGSVEAAGMVPQILHQPQHLVRDGTHLEHNLLPANGMPKDGMFKQRVTMSNAPGIEQDRIDQVLIRFRVVAYWK